VRKARSDKYFRVSAVLWLYRRQPILRDYTVLKTTVMKPEDLAIFQAKVQASQESGVSLPDARASAARGATTTKRGVTMGPERLSAASAKGRATMGLDRCHAAALVASKASLESDYNLGIRTPAQLKRSAQASIRRCIELAATAAGFIGTEAVENYLAAHAAHQNDTLVACDGCFTCPACKINKTYLRRDKVVAHMKRVAAKLGNNKYSGH
jgi:hypothetical protein